LFVTDVISKVVFITLFLQSCLLSTTPMYCAVNSKSSTSYKYDAPVMFFLIAQQ